MGRGIGKKNRPLFRTGIISQLPDDTLNFFLIDGFVQHGQSGGPVFVVTERGSVCLAGITRSFPLEYSNLYEKIDYQKNPNKVILANPGFTVVTKMDKVIPIMKKLGF